MFEERLWGFVPFTDLICDDEGGDEGDGGGTVTPPEEKTFTQDQVNKMIGKRIASEKEEKEQLVSQLEEMRATQGLSEADKANLTEKINKLQGSLQTAEERTKSELSRAQKEFEEKFNEVDSSAKRYKGLFETQSISTALSSAAHAEGAESVDQIIGLYQHSTKLVQDRDPETNELLDSYTPILTFKGLDAKKKVTKMELPVAEAIKKLREDGLNLNLFKGHQVAGSGAKPTKRNADGTPTLDRNTPPTLADYGGDRAAWAKAARDWKKKFSN